MAASLFSLQLKPHRTTLLSRPDFLQPKLTLNFSRHVSIPIGDFSYAKGRGLKQQLYPVVVSCLLQDNSKAEGPSESNHGAIIDLKLPRRSLLVQFTCNACGVRSQKLINRLAYEKGMVFVQCTGCSQYHKLVDNLNLVVEYDFREEINASPDADQV